jgi:hypothetical protein
LWGTSFSEIVFLCTRKKKFNVKKISSFFFVPKKKMSIKGPNSEFFLTENERVPPKMPRSFFWAHRRAIKIVNNTRNAAAATGKPSAPIHPLDTRPGGLKTRNKNMRDLAERAWGSLAIDDADELIRAIEYGAKTEYIPIEDFPLSMEFWMFELDHECESEYPPLRKNDSSSWNISIKQNKIDLKKKKSLVWAAACSR